MWRRPFAVLAAASLGSLCVLQSAGAASVTLSSPSSFGDLRVGQVVTVDVSVDGLAGGDELEFLFASVEYDDSLFEIVGDVRAGEIVPSPLHAPGDFQPLTTGAFAEATFETFGLDEAGGEDHITANGQFFSFDLRATGRGTSEIGIFSAEGLLFNEDNPADPANLDLSAGGTLSATTAIPLPPAVVSGLGGMALVGLTYLGHVRRLRAK